MKTLDVNDLNGGARLIGAFLVIALIIVMVAAAGLLSIRSVNAGMATMYENRLLPAQQLANVNAADVRWRNSDSRSSPCPRHERCHAPEANRSVSA